MLLIKALHIIAVISWLAGLLYLPRLLVYHCDAKIGSEFYEKLQIMERRLLKIITTPAMLASWLFGIILLTNIYQLQIWIVLKFIAIIGLTIFHIFVAKWIKSFANNNNKHSQRFFRLANEVPTCFMIIIVIMVVVKPF